MPNYNKITLAGHLTRDPELVGNAGNICKFGIACNHKWTTKDGEKKDEVLFVDCTAFGKTGETMHKHLSKGRAVLIEGRLRLEQWENDAGEKRSKHTVTVESFIFLGSKDDGEKDEDRPAKKTKAAPKKEIDEDDVPF